MVDSAPSTEADPADSGSQLGPAPLADNLSAAETPPSAEVSPTEPESQSIPVASNEASSNETPAEPSDAVPVTDTLPEELVVPRVVSPFEAAVTEILSNGRIDEETGASEQLFRKDLIRRMYEENGWQPLWNAISIQSLADALNVLVEDGMNPEDYRFEAILPFLDDPAQAPAEDAVVKTDILLTESYLRALYNLRYGKVDPERLDRDHNYATARDGRDHAARFVSWVGKGRIDEAFDQARPDSAQYKRLKEALAHYRRLETDAGWLEIPRGRRGIKPGAENKRISLVRARLAMTGDLACETGPDVLDEKLEKAVRKFQQRHGLAVDGVIGPGTLKVMNAPVEKLIDQLRVNLERQRWFNRKIPSEYLQIDIAGFQVDWIKDGEVIWHEMVQVGKRGTKTPIFQDQIEHIIFNPTWSVPPGIKRRTILPSLKADPSYLDKKGYKLIGPNGKRVDPYSVDWLSLSKMPFTVRQPAGRGNALGRVKFMFPNKHSVFLHDTNHREYFRKQVRLTSSGCIRLRNPFELAEQLLQPQGWDKARIDKTLASGRTIRVELEKPLPILIRYITALATEEEVQFRSDAYRRDAKVLAKLDGPFQLHIPDLPKKRQGAIRAGLRSASKAVHTAPRAELIGIPMPVPDRVQTRSASAAIPSFLDH